MINRQEWQHRKFKLGGMQLHGFVNRKGESRINIVDLAKVVNTPVYCVTDYLSSESFLAAWDNKSEPVITIPAKPKGYWHIIHVDAATQYMQFQSYTMQNPVAQRLVKTLTHQALQRLSKRAPKVAETPNQSYDLKMAQGPSINPALLTPHKAPPTSLLSRW